MPIRSGVIARYGARLPVTDDTPPITLFEGETPCVGGERVCDETGLACLPPKL
jgi:hypothetical protein